MRSIVRQTLLLGAGTAALMVLRVWVLRTFGCHSMAELGSFLLAVNWVYFLGVCTGIGASFEVRLFAFLLSLLVMFQMFYHVIHIM